MKPMKEIKDRFINYVSDNYERLDEKMRKYSINKTGKYDKDIFHHTIIKCYDLIERKNEMTDDTPEGMENYLFKAFKFNLIRDKQYARNAKRNEVEDFSNFIIRQEKYETAKDEKLTRDLFEDFAILFILTKIEEKFSYETAHLYALKHLNAMTYNEIKEKTKLRNTRQRILEATNFVKNNITKEHINSAFQRFFNDEIAN